MPFNCDIRLGVLAEVVDLAFALMFYGLLRSCCYFAICFYCNCEGYDICNMSVGEVIL